MIAGLPPVGCFPIQITTKLRFQLSCADDENRDAQSYNQKLISLLAKIEPTLPGAKLVYADIFSPLIDSIIYPSKYGTNSNSLYLTEKRKENHSTLLD